jgi:hypothetical protein
VVTKTRLEGNRRKVMENKIGCMLRVVNKLVAGLKKSKSHPELDLESVCKHQIHLLTDSVSSYE